LFLCSHDALTDRSDPLQDFGFNPAMGQAVAVVSAALLFAA
jgi:hypothetical protein